MKRSIAAALAALVTVVLGTAESVQAQGRFTVSADGQQVTDTSTRLVWRRCAEGMRFDGKACAGKATRYSYAGARKAGSAGWRVPTREELVGILDKGAKKKPRIDVEAFPQTPPMPFWAARPGSDDNLNAWLVSFSNAQVRANLGQRKFPLRLVRAAG